VRKAVAGLASSRTKLALLVACVAALGFLAVWLAWRGRPRQPPPEARRWYELGAAALRDGTYYNAAKALERAVALYPDYSLAHARLAEARNELDDSEGAKAEMMWALPTGSSQAAQGTDALYVDAIRRTLIRDFTGAISTYTELAGRIPESERAGVLIDLGRVRESNSEIPKALDTYREAIGRDSQNAAAHLRAAILLGLRMRKIEEAAVEFDRADALYRSLSNPEGQVQVLYQRGVVASTQPKLLSEARAILEKAIQLARAINTDHWEIASTLQLSVVTYLEGDAAAAERMAATAVEKACRAGMTNLAARGLSDLGNAQFTKPDYSRAEATYREALEVARRFGLPRNEARALLSLANVHQQQGANGAVLMEAAQALAFYQKAVFQKEAMSCMTLLARANRDLGNLADAGKAFEQLLSLAGTLGDRQQMALAEAGIASVLFQQGRWPNALVHYERFYEIATSIKDRSGAGTALVNRAKVLRALGRYEDAGELLRQAETRAAQPGSSSTMPTLIARELAEIALSRGLFQEAATQANAVLKMPSTTQQVAATTQCLAGLAKARSGSAGEGKRLCSQGVSEAAALSEGATLADARLSLAEILVGNREPLAAQEQVQLALEVFEQSGSAESAWRAWALAARAYRMAGDRAHAQEAAEKASGRLDELRAAWNPADLKRYLARTDLRGLLAEIRGRI
jgi:tetratricopeptide (TPR) repeat protein